MTDSRPPHRRDSEPPDSQRDNPPDSRPDCGPPRRKTKCDADTTDNLWVERADPSRIGICLLDTMSEAQVIHSVERNDVARADLLRVTTDERLLEIARMTPRLPTTEQADEIQSDVNRNNTAASSPFYGIFRGQPPFSQ